MARRGPKAITVPRDSELAARIAEASRSGTALLVEAGETSYRLEVHAISPNNDAEPDAATLHSAPLTPAALYRALDEGRDLRPLLKQLAVDAELGEVAERLEAALRARHPELFDGRGRLRPGKLARLLAEESGGKTSLSGDDLLALEQEADATAERSPGAS